MSNPRYSAEMRERAVKMVMQVRRESGQEKGRCGEIESLTSEGRRSVARCLR
jgi:hypothetical protein